MKFCPGFHRNIFLSFPGMGFIKSVPVELWWPSGHGNQSGYNMTAVFIMQEGYKIIKHWKVGQIFCLALHMTYNCLFSFIAFVTGFIDCTILIVKGPPHLARFWHI